MADLLSVGLDVGTTTTQLIVSRLKVENKASSFAVPEMEIASRQVIYRSEVIFTPLLHGELVDGDAIRNWVTGEYEKAGIARANVDTGAIIITGETSRKENAKAVLEALSDFAGEFVVATAGPDLESVLAAKGAGATALSKQIQRPVLHMDIGGGTSNLALMEKGKILATGCMNVGGRLLKFTQTGVVSYVSPVLQGLTDLRPGDYPAQGQVEAICRILVQGLEMAAGLRPKTELFYKLWTKECDHSWEIPSGAVLSFSGGVADCIEQEKDVRSFGDIGPILGQTIKKSLLCKGTYMLGKETIRATVIGAGCHSTRLSGSTVYVSNLSLPIKNLPVVSFSQQEQESNDFSNRIAEKIKNHEDGQVVLAMPGYTSPSYEKVTDLAKKIAQGVQNTKVLICLEKDMAKALGHCLCLYLPEGTPILCIDRIRLAEDSFLDVGLPVGPAIPVVVKTLILENG